MNRLPPSAPETAGLRCVLLDGGVLPVAASAPVRVLDGIPLLGQSAFWKLTNAAWRAWMSGVFRYGMLEQLAYLGNPFAVVARRSLDPYREGRPLPDLIAPCRNGREFLDGLFGSNLRLCGDQWLADSHPAHIFSAAAFLAANEDHRFIAIDRPDTTPDSHDAFLRTRNHLLKHLEKNFPGRVLRAEPGDPQVIAEFLGIPAAVQTAETPLPPAATLPATGWIEESYLQRAVQSRATLPTKEIQHFLTLCSDAIGRRVRGVLPFWPEFHKPSAPRRNPAADEARSELPAPVRQRIDAALASAFSPEPPTGPCDVAICIAFTGRHDLLEIICEFLGEYAGPGRLRTILVGSTPEDAACGARIAAAHGHASYFPFPNEPLGAKWQFAVECARAHRPGAVVILGSDDLIGPSFLQRAFAIARQDPADANAPAVHGVREWFLWDTSQDASCGNTLWHLGYVTDLFPSTLGAGRIYPASLLDALGWDVFPITWPRYLDARGEERAADRGFPVRDLPLRECPVLSLKGAGSMMNPTARIVSADYIRATPIDFAAGDVLDAHFPGLRERLSATEPAGSNGVPHR